jgi:hypothetical protein
MSPTHRVLVPFELPDAEPLPSVLLETLTGSEVVVLGHYGLPEQTPAAAARDQFEAEARAELDALAEPFAAAGVPVATRLVFGKSRAKAIDGAALEEDCDVILTPGRATAIDRVFVPLRGETNFDRILSFVGELLAATDATVTLYHREDESDRLPGEQILADATDRLVAAGVDPDRISRELADEGAVEQSIVTLAEAYDLVVLGESEPSLRDRVFGRVPTRVTANTDDPAFVVRNVGEGES